MAITRLGGANAITGTLPAANINATSLGNVDVGKVLQVVQTVKTDAFSSTTQESWIDVTGLSVSITPSSTSSKILLTSSVVSSIYVAGTDNLSVLQHRFTGGNSASFVGDVYSNRNRVAYATSFRQGVYEPTVDGRPYTVTYLDSPNTVSAITYQFQARSGDNTGNTSTMYINRTYTNSDISTHGFLAASTITAMEIAG